MIRKKWLYLLIVLQVFILVGIAVSNYMTLHFGERIVLNTEPVDPRDLFYGDYVTLNYEISNLPTDLLEDGNEVKRKQKVFVVLQKSDSVYKAVSVHHDPPDVGKAEVVLKGIVQWMDDYSNQMSIKYGIERFYVEEGEGKSIEDERPERVMIRVAPWGHVAIEQLLSNEK